MQISINANRCEPSPMRKFHPLAVKAVSEGKRDFVKLAVCASTDDICTPCGICRQMLADFSLNMIILCANQNGDYVEKKLSDLLPMAFTGESLK